MSLYYMNSILLCLSGKTAMAENNLVTAIQQAIGVKLLWMGRDIRTRAHAQEGL